MLISPSQQQDLVMGRSAPKPGPPMHPSSVPQRPDGRNMPMQPTTAGRPSHALPSRPDSQPSRTRQPERPIMDRPPEPANNRYDNRGPPQNDYGRLDRPGDIGRHREASPGRRGRLPDGRTPERIPPTAEHREWSGRERDYDDRTMRAPMRDTRAPPVPPPTEEDVEEERAVEVLVFSAPSTSSAAALCSCCSSFSLVSASSRRCSNCCC